MAKGKKKTAKTGERKLARRIHVILAEDNGFDPDKLAPEYYKTATARLLALWESTLDEEDEASLLEDIEDLQNQKADLEEKVRRLEKHLEEAVETLEKREQRIESMILNGAGHWFVYSGQKMVDGEFVDFCGSCHKPKDHYAHFASNVKALSSEGVEKAVEAVRGRLVQFLVQSCGVYRSSAQHKALSLLGGLPGILLAPEPAQEDSEPHCACGAPKSNHPFRHPFSQADPNDRPEGAR